MAHHFNTSVIGFRLVAGVIAWCSFIGCAGPGDSTRMSISSADYQRTFDAAVEVARQESLIGGFRDMRSGVIETDPAFVPTLLEPWHAHREAFDRLVESTVSFQRRRARFEFVPEEAGNQHAISDLTSHEGDLELRVFVHVDRLHIVGRRRSTWTRRVASFEEIQERDETLRQNWVPVGRDTDMERRLLAKLHSTLNQ